MKHCFVIALFFHLMAGSVLAQTAQNNYSAFPTGEGDPDATTCRPPQPMPSSRLNGPEVCKKNSVWAQYRRDGMDVAPDGVHDVPLRGKSGMDCRSIATPGGAAGSVHMGMSCN